MREASRQSEKTHDLASLSLGRLGLAGIALAVVGALVLLWQLLSAPAANWPALLESARGLWISLALILAHAVFTFAVQRLAARSLSGRDQAWSYRLAFLASAGVGLALWTSKALVLAADLSFWQLASTLFGAFLGGLLVTSVDYGVWENSYPPPRHIEEEVRRYHQAFAGRPRVEPPGKRLFDVALALIGLTLLAPLWMLSTFLIWLEDPGPIFFVKNSVGKGGANFPEIKFRSMIRQAEAATGPIPARHGDERVLLIGRFLRKTALDELPQLVNVLRGEMSFVGPRPLRTVVIHEYLKELPQFAERHQVRPGIAGLSQVIGGYYLTPLQRLRFDRVYIRHVGIVLDIQILLLALLIVLWLRWGRSLPRRTPRRWVGLGGRS